MTRRAPGQRAPGQRSRLVGVALGGSPTLDAMNVRSGDVVSLLAILAGDSALTTHLAWQDDGLCGEVGPEIFFIDKGSSSGPARTVCAACPVRAECLTDALEHMGECAAGQFGVWGGTSFNQREWLMASFSGDVQAAVAYAMEQDCLIDTVDMQPRKAVAA